MTTTRESPVSNGVNVQALLDAREALASAPEGAQFTWRATNEWITGTHSVSTVEEFFGLGGEQTHKSTFTFTADHPEVFAAEDNGATPVEYVLVGLASCLTAGVAAVAQNREIQLRSVKATIEYALDPAAKSHFASNAYWGLVKEVQVVDDHTVRFVTKQPWPNLVDSASLTNSLMMPAKALKELGPAKLAEKPIGTGPFKFVEWRRDERLVLERYPDYWQGPADVSRVTFRFIPEFSARMAALLSGEIDVMKDVPPHAVEAIERSGRAKLRATVSSRINYLALVNLKPGPMQDVRVRRAMNHAVDVDELIKQVLKGRATRMCGPLAPPNVDYAPVDCLKYDPTRARALFKEAGIDPSTLTLRLDTPSGRYPLDKDVSLAIGAQLQRLGIKTNVVVNEWGTHLDKIKNRNTGDMFFLGWGPALHGQGTMQPLFLADQTYSSYGNNKALDAKIARAGTLLDPKTRAEAYAELQRLVQAEAPWVFLWQQHDLYGVAQSVEWTPRADEKVWMYDAKVVAR